MTLSMLTVPTSGWRCAADQHVGVVGQAAPPAVAVADRQQRRRGVALGDEAPAVAGALAGRGRASPRRRRSCSSSAGSRPRAAGSRRTGPCRRRRCRSGPCRSARPARAASRRCWPRARAARGARRVSGRAQRANVGELRSRRSRRPRARRRWRSGSSARRAPPPALAAAACGDARWPRARSRVPSRPMPESSLTWTRPPPASPPRRAG